MIPPMTGAVSADPLSGGVDHDVGAVLDRAAQVGCGEGVVDDQRQPRRVSDVGHVPDADNVQLGVADRFDVEGAGAIRDRPAEVLQVRRVDERRLDAVSWQRDREEVVRAAVEAGGRDDLVSGFQEGEDGDRFGRLSRTCCQRPDAPLERRQTLLEDVVRWVHDARVNVAELLQAEEIRGVLGVVEDERARLIDRHRPSCGCWVRLLSGMNLSSVEPG